MILILRGHIRDAFHNQDLKNLVTDMYHMDPTLKIYIHTWNVYSNGVSWRNVDINPQRVNAQTIESYFNELAPLIQHIIIDDDASISLIGNVRTLSSTVDLTFLIIQIRSLTGTFFISWTNTNIHPFLGMYLCLRQTVLVWIIYIWEMCIRCIPWPITLCII